MTEKIQCGGLMERGGPVPGGGPGLRLAAGPGLRDPGQVRPGGDFPVLPQHRQRSRRRQEHVLLREPGQTGGQHRASAGRDPGRSSARPRSTARAPVAILTLYGPHFLEKHNLASEVFSALCVDGINAHTVCSSINSISVVVDAAGPGRTVECLKPEIRLAGIGISAAAPSHRMPLSRGQTNRPDDQENHQRQGHQRTAAWPGWSGPWTPPFRRWRSRVAHTAGGGGRPQPQGRGGALEQTRRAAAGHDGDGPAQPGRHVDQGRGHQHRAGDHRRGSGHGVQQMIEKGMK